MNRKITIVLLISVFLTVQSIFAQYDLHEPEFKIPAFNFVAFYAADVNEGDEVPYSIRNNEYFLESLRLTKLAQDTFEYGDYDASAGFAEEAIRFALLSDEYVAAQLGLRGIATTTTTTTTRAAADGTLPKQYTVRTWAKEKDCLWTIAGYSWVYGDNEKWRELYNANKSKMPNPNNPDLILPGMVLDIPSINNETREGMWQPK